MDEQIKYLQWQKHMYGFKALSQKKFNVQYLSVSILSIKIVAFVAFFPQWFTFSRHKQKSYLYVSTVKFQLQGRNYSWQFDESGPCLIILI